METYKEKRKAKKGRRGKARKKIEEQEKILNYYPPSPIYDLHHEEEILPHLTPQQKFKLDPNYYPLNYISEIEDAPTLVNNLIPDPTWKETKTYHKMQKRKR